MKILTLIVCAAIFTFSVAAFAEPTPSPVPAVSPTAKEYTCPMHPEVVKNKPGKCPKCGMKLEPKKE